MLFAVLVLFSLGSSGYATHNRAGEILYQRVNDNPFLYRISIITYTKTDGQSAAADRCELELHFGDGTRQTVLRKNGPVSPDCSGGARAGEVLPGTNTRYNVYQTQHAYPGPGTYRVSMEDPMRIGGILNIVGSDNVPFYIESYITIDVGSGGNNAPVLQNPPIDNGCVSTPFYHNPGAVDPEGDSLVYTLVPCRSFNGTSISGYQYPNQIQAGPNNVLNLDPVSGTLSWISPQQQGLYNIAILIEEYRTNDNSGEIYKVGSILRDMQISIGPPCSSSPPSISVTKAACVTAGDLLQLTATASDVDSNRIELTAVGFPLDDGNGGILVPGDTVSGLTPLNLTLRWQTNCTHARNVPYWMYWKAKEDLDLPAELVYFETTKIQVVDPGVLITSIEPQGTSLILEWTTPDCDNASEYSIYRSTDSTGYVGSNCITGVPDGIGYEFVAKRDASETRRFVDDNDGTGLNHGVRYAYMIVVQFDDNSQSYPSPEELGELIGDVPIMNKVSINSTDRSNGTDSVAWFNPTELDESKWPSPYRYKLFRNSVGSADFEEVFATNAENTFSKLDTLFVDTDLNTEKDQYIYRIQLYSGPSEELVGSSRAATSVYLTSSPGDNKLRLSWNLDVPWKNDYYVVYKEYSDSQGVYYPLDTTLIPEYIDSNLVNLRKYRYKVLSVGKYSSVDFPQTLTNWSQIHVGTPIDNEPPCSPPNQIVDGDCDLEHTYLSWVNPNEHCPKTDDVIGYRIYFSPILGEFPDLLVQIDDPDETEYTHYSTGSIAGCYAIVAVDSFGNESDFGEPKCIDNCPLYELPNIFTPGSDGRNDFFVPLPDQFRFVESIDIHIFNRWGVEVFHTTDPEIMWDGSDIRTGNPLPDGVYFYACIVNEIFLAGIKPRELNSYVHLMREGDKTLAQ